VPSDPEKDPKSYLKFYGLAFELVILNVVAIWGGYELDQYFSTQPVIVLLGTAVAIAATIKLLLSRLQ
jgi:F0F1-type ATP synthase assembly protein I